MLKVLGFGGSQPKHSASTQSLTALDEPYALKQAMKEKALESGQSSFHKLASGVIAFLGATLGFEADIMKEASERLADAEASAERDRKRAVKENHHSGRLPPGTEFALCHAEAQLMSAVVGLLSESVSETLRAFYRLRTAYRTLEGIHTVISMIELENTDTNLRPTSRHTSDISIAPAESLSGVSTSSRSGKKEDKICARPTSMASLSKTPSRIGRDELELFTISGCLLCFGLLLLLLGMVPPSLGRVMSIVGFRGNRPRGLAMLWEAAEADNVHGAIAVLVILQYYGNAVQFCDILPPDDEEGGYPKQRCQQVLSRIRHKYPRSALWKLEEARMEAVDGFLENAVTILSQPIKTEMRQVEALILFEKSINSMFLHQYEEVAEGFLKLMTLNKWSHGLYNYFAAGCYVELYRSFKGTDAVQAEKYAKLAEELIIKVPTFMGKKRFMAQGLPLELFADRKIKKWQARATEQGVRLVDGVGVSPVEEMIYIWNGYKRMAPVNLEISLKTISFGRNHSREEADEHAIRFLLESVVYRRSGDLAKAKELLSKVINVPTPKGAPHDEWMAPTAHYEMAAALWQEHGPGEHSGEIKAWLTKAAGWGAYELDTRVGMKIQTALDTINRYSAAATAAKG